VFTEGFARIVIVLGSILETAQAIGNNGRPFQSPQNTGGTAWFNLASGFHNA